MWHRVVSQCLSIDQTHAPSISKPHTTNPDKASANLTRGVANKVTHPTQSRFSLYKYLVTLHGFGWFWNIPHDARHGQSHLFNKSMPCILRVPGLHGCHSSAHTQLNAAHCCRSASVRADVTLTDLVFFSSNAVRRYFAQPLCNLLLEAQSCLNSRNTYKQHTDARLAMLVLFLRLFQHQKITRRGHVTRCNIRLMHLTCNSRIVLA